jgi:hypothetical protein
MSPKASVLLIASAISGTAAAATQVVVEAQKTDANATSKAVKSVVEGIAVDVSAIDSSATFGTFPMHN